MNMIFDQELSIDSKFSSISSNSFSLTGSILSIFVYLGRYTPTRFKTPKTILNLMDLKEDSGVAPLGSTVKIQVLRKFVSLS